MWFSKKEGAATPTSQPAGQPASQVTTKVRGDAAEALALAHLQSAGLRLLDTNYRTPGRGGGEIDLVMRDKDGTLVFVEVRARQRIPRRRRGQHQHCQTAAHCFRSAALPDALQNPAALPL